MNREIKMIANGLLAVIVILLLAACASRPQSMGSSGTAWGTGAFRSNGERIYFTAMSERGTAITYTSGPASSGWMMGAG
jgi:starvation-inducible outer membrane lipoprotein